MRNNKSKLVKSIIISEADVHSQQDNIKKCFIAKDISDVRNPADTHCQYLKEPTYFYRKFFNLYECIKTGGGINDICEHIYCHGSKHFCKIAPYDTKGRGGE
jgi:hypothetical protein